MRVLGIIFVCIVVWLLGLAALYGAVAFVEVTPDFSMWTPNSRMTVAIIGGIFTAIVVLVCIIATNPDKDD